MSWHIVGITGSLCCFLCAILTYRLILRTAKILKGVFSQERSQKQQVLKYNLNFPEVCARMIPLYGSCRYSRVQYDLPGVVHVFLICLQVQVTWGLNLALAKYLGFSLWVGLGTGVLCSSLVMSLSVVMHSAFLASFHPSVKQTREDPTFIQDCSMVQEEEVPKGKLLEGVLIVSISLLTVPCALALYISFQEPSQVMVWGLIQCGVGLVQDIPYRLVVCLGLKATKLLPVYEKRYFPFDREISPEDLPKYESQNAPCNSPIVYRSPSKNSRPLEEAQESIVVPYDKFMGRIRGFSPSFQKNLDPLSEFEVMPDETVVSHNEESEEEIIVEHQEFPETPCPSRPIFWDSPSPQKNSSPHKFQSPRKSSIYSSPKYYSPQKRSPQKNSCLKLMKCESPDQENSYVEKEESLNPTLNEETMPKLGFFDDRKETALESLDKNKLGGRFRAGRRESEELRWVKSINSGKEVDHKVFQKKRKSKLLKDVDKLVPIKEDPDVQKLKEILEKRQKFKEKHTPVKGEQ